MAGVLRTVLQRRGFSLYEFLSNINDDLAFLPKADRETFTPERFRTDLVSSS